MAGGGVAALGVKKERAAEYKGRMTLAVAMACLVAAVGGSIFGYDIGISGKSCSRPHTHPNLTKSPVIPSTPLHPPSCLVPYLRSSALCCVSVCGVAASRPAMGHRKRNLSCSTNISNMSHVRFFQPP